MSRSTCDIHRDIEKKLWDLMDLVDELEFDESNRLEANIRTDIDERLNDVRNEIDTLEESI